MFLQESEESRTDDESETDQEYMDHMHDSCHSDLYRHPRLDADIDSVRSLYSDSAISIRELDSLDGVDIDLHVTISSVNESVAKACRINSSEPIIIRLHFSPSQYLDGPAPTVEVFQPSKPDKFGMGKQLQSVLTVFIRHEWKHLTNLNTIGRQKVRNSWFRPVGTIKKFRARLSIWLPLSKSTQHQETTARRRIDLPLRRLNHFSNQSYNIKNPSGEVFTYTPSGKRVVVSAVKSSAQLSTKQLIELLFFSQAVKHCKAAPSLQHGFLVQIMKYAEQRIPTLSEYCVVCDERHVFQSGPMFKPAVCSRELCVFSHHALGVMSDATDEVATGSEVVDLLVAMCREALLSSRKSIVFDPYPSVVDPCNPKTLAFSPKMKSFDRLQKALDTVLMIRRMSQGPYSDLKKQMDMIDPLAQPLLQWILSSNRSHIVKLPPTRQLEIMHTPHQFLLISSPPAKEARFQAARKLYGSTFAFHGSHIENWHSILRNGLVNASYTKLQLHGAAYGKGIYLSPISSVSFGYSEMGKGQHQITTRDELLNKYNKINKLQQGQLESRFLQSRNLNCIALCEVITSKDLQKHGNIWVCPVPDYVCTRFLFVYENGQVGNVHINTEDAKVQSDILQVITASTS
ncbi:protein mono-ADP-ribosyltransferase PARP6-like isoform 2-T2 [Synchiropus picturatus]